MKPGNKSLLAGIACLLVSNAHADGHNVPYPTGYQSWYHVKSMLIQPGHPLENPFQGIHHVYANDQAEQGLQTGQYPDGAVFAFDLLDYQEQDKTIQEGKRKLLGVMHRDAERYRKTGGWGFEAFAGSSRSERLTSDGGVSCYSCHTSVKESDYVFSKLR